MSELFTTRLYNQGSPVRAKACVRAWVQCMAMGALLLGPGAAVAQVQLLSLAEAHRLAIAHLPASRNDSLAEAAAARRLDNLTARWLPALSVNGQAAVQSDAVRIGVGPSRIEQPLERFQATLDVNQTLYDGGNVAASRLLEQAQLAADRQAVLVEHQAVKTRVNGFYFATLITDRSIELSDSLLGLLAQRIRTAEAALRGGTLLARDLRRLQAEQLRQQQRRAELVADRQTLVAALEILTGARLDGGVQLQDPAPELRETSEALIRPELRLFDLSSATLSQRAALVASAYRPRVSAFAQGGVGYPNPLNFPDIQVRPFGVVGLRLSWTLSSWGAARRDRELIGLQQHQVRIQRDAFEQNLRVALTQERGQAAKLDELLARDESLIALQNQITRETQVQYELGTATLTDYLSELNAEHSARLTRELHRLQRSQSVVNQLSIKGQF